jgi:hypothetical protein
MDDGPTDAAELAPFARRLLGVTVTGLWRLSTVSTDGAIPLPGELVLETGTGFVSLSHTQQGLSCRGPVPRPDIGWATEPDLTMGRSEGAGEWLDLARLDQPAPALPLAVAAVTGWFGLGTYLDAFALILSGADRELVLMTTDAFDLRPATRAEARRRADAVATNLNLRLVEQELRL